MADEVSPEQAQVAPAPAGEEQPVPAPPVTEQPAPQPAPNYAQAPIKELIPPEIEELDDIILELNALKVTCEEALAVTDSLLDQQAVQAGLSAYSQTLPHLPRALQLLNDIRRFFPAVTKHSEEVRNRLVKVRGGDDDAISSEEARIIVACASVTETILESLNALEQTFSNVRLATPTLLSLLSYDKPGFATFAKGALRVLRIDLVSDVIHGEYRRLVQLKQDLELLYELDAHASELENVSQAEG